jgi:hypothetical protein
MDAGAPGGGCSGTELTTEGLDPVGQAAQT